MENVFIVLCGLLFVAIILLSEHLRDKAHRAGDKEAANFFANVMAWCAGIAAGLPFAAALVILVWCLINAIIGSM